MTVAALIDGTKLGDRFVLHGVLGRGGMATVYLAEDLSSGQRVALKLLHPHLAADPTARRRLQREVDAAARLDHPGVLVATEAVNLDGQVGLVLPLHLGRTLAEVVAMDGPLPPNQVRRLGIRLSEALGAAHRAGILHRDLTCRNVLIDDRGTPVLTDFGLARLQDQGTARSTALLGTAGFIAPEVLSGHRADPRSDLYSLGAVLYQAATGVEPFGGAHPQAALQAQIEGRVTPITDRLPDFPPWLAQSIHTLLDSDPARRPQGAAAVISALKDGRAPEPPPQTGPLPSSDALTQRVTARLPEGVWTVAVGARSRSSRHRRRGGRKSQRTARRVAHKLRGMGQAGGPVGGQLGSVINGVMNDLGDVVEQVAGAVAGPSEEEQLAVQIARHAGLSPQAIDPSPALELDRYRLVAHVDRPTADAMANQARILGLTAQVYPERQPDTVAGWLLQHWWLAIPLMWISFPALIEAGGPDAIVFLFTAMTVLLSAIAAPMARRRLMPPAIKRLPIAYTNDLAPQLHEGWQADATTTPQADAVPGNAVPVDAVPVAQTRGQLLAAQAQASLDGLAATIDQHRDDLSQPAAADLHASSRELRQEIDELAAEAQRLDAALDRAASQASSESGGWAAERLARLNTLHAAGQPVDPAERQQLTAAVAAHQAATEAELALDSLRTATLARLLEIGATARRLARELDLAQAQGRRPARALDDLRQQSGAAAAARRELASQS